MEEAANAVEHCDFPTNPRPSQEPGCDLCRLSDIGVPLPGGTPLAQGISPALAILPPSPSAGIQALPGEPALRFCLSANEAIIEGPLIGNPANPGWIKAD